MNYNIIAVIPARSGSKGIPNKNIRLYKNKPLLAHSIEIAKKCPYINKVYVSTDSEEYQKIAIEYGALAPFLRPKNISDDMSSDYEMFEHFIGWYENNYQLIPDILIHLRPTYPNRKIEWLNESIEIFIKNIEKYDSLRSVVLLDKTPYKMYYINEENELKPYFSKYSDKNMIESFNQARQYFPQTYLHNGCIDIFKTILLKESKISGDKIYPYIMDENEKDDIDTIDDFERSEKK